MVTIAGTDSLTVSSPPSTSRVTLTVSAASSTALANKTPADFGVDTAPRLETLNVVEPPKRSAGIKVGTVDELVEKLKALGVAK